jgi:hypothetical protein
MDAIDGIKEVHHLLSQNLDQDLVPELPLLTTFQGWPAIQLDNRYFTSRRIAPNERPVVLDPVIDPSGALRSLIDNDWAHLEENRVKYYERVNKQTGSS